MVRVNLVEPRKLADQHLIAEYDEILMLLGYVRRYPLLEDLPKSYTLGKGHIKFFKDKLSYLKKRHELIKEEMRKRGFATQVTIDLGEFPKSHLNEWTPKEADYKIIRARITEKLLKKPDYYRYYGQYKPAEFFIRLINSK